MPQFSRGFASLYNGSLLVGPLLLSKHFTIYKDVNFKNKEDQGREFCNWPCLELMMRVYLENAIYWCSYLIEVLSRVYESVLHWNLMLESCLVTNFQC